MNIMNTNKTKTLILMKLRQFYDNDFLQRNIDKGSAKQSINNLVVNTLSHTNFME